MLIVSRTLGHSLGDRGRDRRDQAAAGNECARRRGDDLGRRCVLVERDPAHGARRERKHPADPQLRNAIPERHPSGRADDEDSDLRNVEYAARTPGPAATEERNAAGVEQIEQGSATESGVGITFLVGVARRWRR
jgi:hypothetical protein